MAKLNKITVEGIDIAIKDGDKICITDMIKAKDGDFVVSDWLRNRNTLDYIGAWESMHNQEFNYGEFATIRNSSGVNGYKISVKEWCARTNSIGIEATAGRYGGTYAHKDIAFNFCMWISPVFQLYVVKEYQRLKEIETNQYNLEWNVRRILTKANYDIHTDAIKNYVIPRLSFGQKKEWIYADEADVLNIVLFGCTAKQWKEANPARALKGENIRDMASINELAILSNIESLNAVLNKEGIDKKRRMKILYNTVLEQKSVLDKVDILKSIKKESEKTFVEASKTLTTTNPDKTKLNKFPINVDTYKNKETKASSDFDEKLTANLKVPSRNKKK